METAVAKEQRSRRVKSQILILVGILLVVMITATVLKPRFLTYSNIMNVMTQNAMVVLTGSAAVLLMVSGNFDLSVGMVLSLTGVMHAFMSKNGIPTNGSIVVATLIGTAFGLMNGVMVTKLNIPSVIATLGSMYIARGFAFIVAWVDGGANVVTGLPLDFEVLGRKMVAGVPLYLYVFLAIIAACYFIFAQTNLGKQAFAIGSNRRAAVLSGIKVGKTILILYLLVGSLAGLAGVTVASRVGSGAPAVGTGFEFDVIVAMVLGGTSIYGGEGSFLGMIVGALIVGFVGNLLNLMNIMFFYQIVVKGAILVVAVLMTQKVQEKLLAR
jgi:ribose/xylose/arabinose/galactoside ABC-type transport system permease subunit